MVTKEEFGQFISEFESFREHIFKEISNIKSEIENIREDFKDFCKKHNK